jgi:uncharacterized SAM-dependent methyltransferase
VHSTILGESFAFAKGETIYTEQSKKYTLDEIDNLAQRAGFMPHPLFTDANTSYAIVAWQA